MAVTLSGILYYDGNRTAAAATATGTIAGVSITLQDISTTSTSGMMVTVMTSSTGTFAFTNVPSGSYQVVEDYGRATTFTDTVDWSQAVVGDIINGGTVPPISYVSSSLVPASATNLDCTVRNTWLETVAAANITNIYMLNGPVAMSPLVLDPNYIVDGTNLITVAANGTFGSFSPGTTANTGAGSYPANQGPYPEIQSQFLYTQPNSGAVTPDDGYYTVQNIMNNAWSNSHPSAAAPAWWRVADHTTGNETGRMMVINGYTAGYVIGQSTVAVDSNTNYLSSYWVLNLCRQSTGYVLPEFSVIVYDENGVPIYEHDFSDEIVINTDCPEWIQIGTVFNSGENSFITVAFVSQGGPQTGNDYVLDDVALNKVDILTLTITKDATCDYVLCNGMVEYVITIENETDLYANQILLTDDPSVNLENIEYTIDGENWFDWTGTLDLDDLDAGESAIVRIRGTIKQGIVGTITNSAQVDSAFCLIDEEADI